MAKKLTRKQFVIIGLGRFGVSVCKELYELGADVVAIDQNPDSINNIEPFCTEAICADASDEKVLNKLAINNFDVAVICIGSNIESSIFITLMCKQLGVDLVIAKAQDTMHKTVLKKVGADMVIIPEEEMGEKLAASIYKPNIIEVMSLTKDFNIVEIITPEKWQNKSLIELNLRNTEKVTVMLIKRGDDIIITPGGDCVLLEGDILMIAGLNENTKKLSAKATKTVPQEIGE